MLLDAEMSADTRFDIINDFNISEKHSVLLTTYSLNIAGLDAHKRCAAVISVEPGFNLATERQAQSRVHRFGQTEVQQITRLFLSNTYNETHEFCLVGKAAPILEAFGALAKYMAIQKKRCDSTPVTSRDLAAAAFGMTRHRPYARQNLWLYKAMEGMQS